MISLNKITNRFSLKILSLKSKCLVKDCEKDQFRRSLCTTHFFRAYRSEQKAKREAYKLEL